ncbi:MAG: acyl-CoA reductase [Rikenellaceae bacterium]
MKSVIEIFSTLGDRLINSGRDSCQSDVINAACRENSWFSREDIIYAVEALREKMLSQELLERWLAEYDGRKRQRVLLIMAGNIPLVGFFDLLCVIASGGECYYKPSSKDRVLIDYIAGLLKEIEPAIPIYKYSEHSPTPDKVIATGGESAAKSFRAQYGHLPTLIRSSRHSIALLKGDESAGEIERLCSDIYRYSGLGCRNVSMLFIPRSKMVNLPKFTTNDKYHRNYLQTRAVLTLDGESFIDNGCSIFRYRSEFPSSLSTISLFEYDSLEDVDSWIASHDEQLQCIVGDLPHTRCIGFGESQRPGLWDYADEVDVMKFLLL